MFDTVASNTSNALVDTGSVDPTIVPICTTLGVAAVGLAVLPSVEQSASTEV